MRLASRLLAVVLGAVLLLAGPVAFAQEPVPAGLDERVEAVRKLSREDQMRLKEALRRFKSMSEEERKQLRDRARTIGSDRLRELSRRDVKKLRSKHDELARERAAIVELLGRERLMSLSEPERRYVKALTMRSFQRHVKRRLLNIAGPRFFEEFQRLPPHERARRGRQAMEKRIEQLIAELSPERQAELRALPPQEQRKARHRLVAEFRMRETIEFARVFDAITLTPYLRRPVEERIEIAERWAERERWFEMKRVLERELRVSRDTLRLMRGMRADEWARVRDVYERTEGMPRDQRRLALEDEIRRVYGSGSLDERRRKRGPRKKRGE